MSRFNGHRKAAPGSNNIELRDGEITIAHLTFHSAPVQAFLERTCVGERPASLAKACEVGVLCLERAGDYRDLDFVRQQIEQQVKFVSGEMQRIPVLIAQQLTKQLGTDDGQVLAPIKTAILGTEKLIKERMAAVQTLLDKEIDPRRTDTTLGKALATIGALLDAKQDGSVQKGIEKSLKSIAADDGALAGLVTKTANAAVKPLLDAVDRLRKDVQRQTAEENTLAQTIAKGAKFEDELAGTLQLWAKFNGASIEAIGKDRRPGDFLITLTDPSSASAELRIVIEARDDAGACGRKRISDDLGEAIKTRNAHFGIYVAKKPAGLAREIGDWSEGRCRQGAWVACTAANLLLAVRFAIVDLRHRTVAMRAEVDAQEIGKQLGHVRASLRRLRTIRNRSSDIHKNADSIVEEADELRREVADALSSIEMSLHCPATPGAPIAPRKRGRTA